QHPPGAPARVQGLARRAGRARRRREGHGLHDPRRHRRGGRRPDPGPGGGPGPPRRPRGHAARAQQGGRAPPLPSDHPGGARRPVDPRESDRQHMRALLSVYDKSGIVELARELRAMGWSLISSGGTASTLRDAGLAVTDVAELTGFPAILSHRVVTLHPKVHGGILADRHNHDHQREMAEYGIEPIDLVVTNLYPFGSDLSDFEHGATRAEELIDIGGPAMIRAAAKNFKDVGVVTHPS